MRHIAQLLDVDYDDEELESVTIIGYLQDQLERFPEVGDVVDWFNLKMTVQKTTSRGQALVHIRKMPVTDDQNNNGTGSFFTNREKET